MLLYLVERVTVMRQITVVLLAAGLVVILISTAVAMTHTPDQAGPDRYWAGWYDNYEQPPELRTYHRNSFYPETYRHGRLNRYPETNWGWDGPNMYRYYRFGDRDSVPMFR